ncbi:MAG: hypothetical protein V4671_24580 [Armatimonadota bacterium]
MKVSTFILGVMLGLTGCSNNVTPGTLSLEISTPSPTPASVPSSSPTKTAKTAPPQLSISGDVSLKVTAVGAPGNRVRFIGTTNLPDDMAFMVTVDQQGAGMTGQTSSVIRKGRIETQAIGPETGLSSGIYDANLTVSVPMTQPDSVKAIIGQQGENLRGPLVERSDLGPSVSVNTRFSVGPNGVKQGVSAKDRQTTRRLKQANIEEARSILKALRLMEEQGRSMEGLRHSEDLGDIAACGDLMRERQPKTDALEARAGALPTELGFHLEIAANEMNIGVSCLRTAKENLDRARVALNDAEKAVRSF